MTIEYKNMKRFRSAKELLARQCPGESWLGIREVMAIYGPCYRAVLYWLSAANPKDQPPAIATKWVRGFRFLKQDDLEQHLTRNPLT
ncbi:MAG TPA: hypothetical protein PK406_14990 [Verrucomicrobiota bacterium]|nr:hypothetical protein [Verrucomicrobiota bacterium]